MSRKPEKEAKESNADRNARQADNAGGKEQNGRARRAAQGTNAQSPLGKEASKPMTSDDYLYLAEGEPSKKKQIKYLNQALALDPGNLDASRMLAELTAKHPQELAEELSRLLEESARRMADEGFFSDENRDERWNSFEMWSYMHFWLFYIKTLMKCGMLRRAAGECEKMLALREEDELNVRYDLMHLYAMLEEEEAARAVMEKFPKDETQMLLPLSILYFKLGQTDKALEALKRLSRINTDTKKFLNAVRSNQLEKYMQRMTPNSYLEDSIDELILEAWNYTFLFQGMIAFFEWGYQALRKETAKK